MHRALTERGRVLDVGMDPLAFSIAGRVGDIILGGRQKLPTGILVYVTHPYLYFDQ